MLVLRDPLSKKLFFCGWYFILSFKGPGYYKLPEIVLRDPFGKNLARKDFPIILPFGWYIMLNVSPPAGPGSNKSPE